MPKVYIGVFFYYFFVCVVVFLCVYLLYRECVIKLYHGGIEFSPSSWELNLRWFRQQQSSTCAIMKEMNVSLFEINVNACCSFYVSAISEDGESNRNDNTPEQGSSGVSLVPFEVKVSVFTERSPSFNCGVDLESFSHIE